MRDVRDGTRAPMGLPRGAVALIPGILVTAHRASSWSKGQLAALIGIALVMWLLMKALYWHKRQVQLRKGEILSDVPRFGSDLGGVLNRHHHHIPTDETMDAWHLMPESEAPGAMEALAEIVLRFGAPNVFVISRVGCAMQRVSEIWLHETMHICQRTGLLRQNIHFCPEVEGPCGKGPIAAKLGITHFVDDKDSALRSVFQDSAGNSGRCIERHGGQLFFFSRSGLGDEPPQAAKWSLHSRPKCVVPVANWSQLMLNLNVRRCIKPGTSSWLPWKRSEA